MSSPPTAPWTAGSTLHTVGRVLVAGHAAVVGVGLLFSGAESQRANAVLVAALLAGIAGCALLPRVPTAGRWAGRAALAVALVLTALTPHMPGWAGAQLLVLAALAVGALGRGAGPREPVLVVLSLGAVHAGAVALAGGSLMVAVDDTVMGFLVAVTVRTARDLLQESVTTAERNRQRLATAQAQAAWQHTVDRAEAHAHEVVHDEVIGALLSVARADTRPTLARATCRRAAVRLTAASEEDGAQSLQAVVEAAAADSSLTVEIGATSEPAVELDPTQARVVQRAVREALRNVARHAQVGSCQVRWRVWRDGVVLDVLDRGPGPSDGGARWGLEHSVRLPLASIGGTAELSRTGGSGWPATVEQTRLRLQWPVERPEGPQPATGFEARWRQSQRAAGSGRDVLRRMAGLLVLGHCYLALRWSWGDVWMTAELGLALAVSLATLMLVRHLSERIPDGHLLVAVALAAAGVTAAGLALAGPGSTTSYDSWVIALSSVSLTLVACYSGPWWFLVLVGPQLAVVLTVALTQSAEPLAASTGALLAVVAPPASGLVVQGLLRRAGRTVETEHVRLHEVLAVWQYDQARHEADSRHLAVVRATAGEWLQRVGAGELDPADPRVQSEARSLADRVRDHLYFPGLLDEALTARIAAARACGTPVVVQAPDGILAPAALVLRLLDRALDHAEELERIVVRLPTEEDPVGTLTLCPALAEPLWSDLLRAAPRGHLRTEQDDWSITAMVHASPVFGGGARPTRRGVVPR